MERSLCLATTSEFTQRLPILARRPRNNSQKRPSSMSDSFGNGLVPRLPRGTLAMMQPATLFFSLPSRSQYSRDIPLFLIRRPWILITGTNIAKLSRVSSDIASQQLETAKNKLRLDLFDRRWAAFEAAMKLAWIAVREGNVTQEQRIEFSVAIKGVEFLFNKELQGYCDELGRAAINLHVMKQSDGCNTPRR